MNPFFSIVIPTHNRARLVQECVRSVLRQTFPDFEVVVVDDGSTDHTSELVNAIGSEKVRLYSKVHGERGAARNFGIDKAKGDYVVFLDSDDTLEPNHLEALHRHLANQPEDFISTRYFFFNESGRLSGGDVNKLHLGYHDYRTFLPGNPLACCFTIRRSNPGLIRFREELNLTIMEDWIFLMENLQRARIFILPDVTVGMRDHELRSMRGNAGRIIAARNNATKYLLGALKFSETEERELVGKSFYFCAVHSYIGHMTRTGFQYLLKSIRNNGISMRAGWLFLKLCVQVLWVRQAKRES